MRDLDHGRAIHPAPSLLRIDDADGSTVKQQEVNMTDYVETPADRETASVTSSRELSEAELSTVADGAAGKVTFNPFSITRHVDKASPVLFL
jgi:type VI protein secretion system component Hcp